MLVRTAAAIALAAPPVLAQDVVTAGTDIEGFEQLQREIDAVEAALEVNTGVDVELFAVPSRTAVAEVLINGDISTAGMNRGIWRAREAYPDTAFRVVARGPDLPNDILAAASNVARPSSRPCAWPSPEDGEAMMRAVPMGEDNVKYEGGFFLGAVDDADYDHVSDICRTIRVNGFGAFVGA